MLVIGNPLDPEHRAPATGRMLVVSASVGAGHDGVAAEVARRAAAVGYDVDRVDFLHLLPFGLGRLLRSLYWFQLTLLPVTWGWILALVGRGEALGSVARLSARLSRRRLLRLLDTSTSVVVSTYPLASQALSALRIEGTFRCPMVTFLTDMSVHGLWVAPGVDGHLALHDVAAGQARALGAQGVRVIGPLVPPAFRPATPGRRARARQWLDVGGDLPLALVVAGSWGMGEVVRTVDDLLATGLVTPVVVCGTNERLRRRLSRRDGVVALGWVTRMPLVMAAADVVVQNAGGLSSLEARQCGIPIITYRTLPGHGVTNAAALETAGWTTWVRRPDELAAAVEAVLASSGTPAGGWGQDPTDRRIEPVVAVASGRRHDPDPPWRRRPEPVAAAPV